MKYEITAPMVGKVWAQIEAKSEEEAKCIFHDKWYEGLKIVDNAGDDYEFEIEEIDVYEEINSGNVCHLPHDQWEMAIDLVKDE